jgi:hypothetical protein
MGDIGEDVHLETMQIPVHEDVNLDSTQLLNLSSQLVTTMAHDREAMRPVAGQGCTLKNFFSYSFDSFDGNSDRFDMRIGLMT